MICLVSTGVCSFSLVSLIDGSKEDCDGVLFMVFFSNVDKHLLEVMLHIQILAGRFPRSEIYFLSSFYLFIF